MKKLYLQDMRLIENAVQKAESKTSGEIVPVIYNKCTNTQLIFPLLFILLSLTWHVLQDQWFPINFWEGHLFTQIGLPLLVVGAISFFLSQAPWVQRLFISKRRREQFVRDRAELEFYRCGIPQTQDRTGILLFVSLLERYSVVLADKRIAEKLPKETWDEVLSILNSKITPQHFAQGFVPAIEKCGDILAAHLPKEASDTDELPNQPILRLDYV
ncbi:MAG: TPM domain-containing protein [Deltaproteobacteria bacterium]